MGEHGLTLPPFFAELVPVVERELESRLSLPGAPPRLVEAMRYAVLGGGKRLRPVMTLLACRLVSGEIVPALPAAAALEMIHAYSLVHDDLPSMDDDDMRRGRPTTHRRFGEAMAILTGDALQTLAFRTLADTDADDGRLSDMLRTLSESAGAGGMVGGQVLDIDGSASDAGELDALHSAKTGALFRAAVALGATAGGASEEDLARLDEYASSFGIVFQISDDLLDVEGDPQKTGRYRGSDSDAGRSTYPAILGVAESRSRMHDALEKGIDCLSDYGSGADELGDLLRFAAYREG